MASAKLKAAKKVSCKKACCTDEPKSFVFLIKSDALDGNVVQLRHPHKSIPSFFLLSQSQKVYEIFTYNDSHRSYFLNDSVQSDGRMYLTTTIDPLLIAIPYLQSSPHCSPIDHVLKDDEYPEIEKLLDYLPNNRLDLIADMRGDTDLRAYKFNEEKTLNWLSGKVKKIAGLLKKEDVNVNSNSTISANFVKGAPDKDSDESYLIYGLNIIGDYLPEDLKDKLSKHMNIDVDVKIVKRKRQETEDNDIKKSKVESESSKSTNNTVQKAKTPPVSAKGKARVKAAAGSKNISSFFQKKT